VRRKEITMSRSTTPSRITGHAVVRLKTGQTYVGHAIYDGRSVTIDGSLRVVRMVDGDSGVFTYRPRKRRTVPMHLVREVIWDDDRHEQ
jgi:hypothetical protein